MTSALQELELAYRGLSDEDSDAAAEPAEEAGGEEDEEGFGDDALDPSAEEEEI